MAQIANLKRNFIIYGRDKVNLNFIELIGMGCGKSSAKNQHSAPIVIIQPKKRDTMRVKKNPSSLVAMVQSGLFEETKNVINKFKIKEIVGYRGINESQYLPIYGEETNTSMWNPLHWAIFKGETQIVHYFLKEL